MRNLSLKSFFACAVVGLNISGCVGYMINPSLMPDSYTFKDIGNGAFGFYIAPDKFKEMHDKGNSEVRSFVEAVLTKRHICPKGFNLSEPEYFIGYVVLSGHCITPGQ